jgi:phosphoenolpyruvate-protein kinase (PTS system EI component)
MRHIRAKSIYPGRIRGLMAEFRRERFIADEKTDINPKSEFRHFKAALRAAQLQLAGEKKMMLDRRRKNPGEMAAIDEAIDVLESHILTLEDPFFLGEIKNRIFGGGATAAAALGAVISMVSRQFTFDAPKRGLAPASQNRHFLKDMTDMKRRILFFLGLQQELRLPEGVSIVAAPRLTVSEVLALKRAGVRGIIIGETSETAHEIVMLRAMRIPCVSVSDARFFRLKKHTPVLLDADIGYVVLQPKKTARFTESNPENEAKRWSMQVRLQSGERHNVSGTMHFLTELGTLAGDAKKESIGLYRTEYQISEAGEMPSARALQRQYEEILQAPVEVTFRLFDFSEDKNFLAHPLIERDRELRGVRFLLKEKKILETQISALVRAAQTARKRVRMLIPYLSEWHELAAIREIVRAALPSKNMPEISLGGMLETAGGVFNARRWADKLHFLYVGTSDLLSAIAAERRENSAALHRALLSDAFVVFARELRSLARHRPLTICGEVAGEPWAIAWLAAHGFRDYTMPTHRMAVVTNMLQALSRAQCSQFARAVLKIEDESQRVETAKQLALDILYGRS